VTIRRAYADLPHGQVHYAECGDAGAPPVLLLHQSPRSWAEYRAVLPLLGARYRAIAMDTAGFGASDPLPGAPSIEAWAAVALQLLDALGIARCHVVGHHTGGVIALELAARDGARVRSLVLSSTPFTDDTFRRARAQRPPIDAVQPSDDGAHLAALWRKRQAFYPPQRADLLHAFVLDAMKVHDVEAGHRAVAAYRMEERIAAIRQPTLLVLAPDDPFGSAHAAQWLRQLPHAQLVDIEGGMVPLPDQLPQAFAQAVLHFLDAQR
jgi:pimeloyl-ACP methyl ester carboxylesterase